MRGRKSIRRIWIEVVDTEDFRIDPVNSGLEPANADQERTKQGRNQVDQGGPVRVTEALRGNRR